ncbi:hypothetical protein Hdeb2414_s0033g00718901 [Helianthus debilis subsp. tardiflorus]
MVVVVVVDEGRERRRRSVCCVCVLKRFYVKKNPLLLADCRHLVHLFSCRCLQMWSADCRPFPAEKTNSTLMLYFLFETMYRII